MSNTDERLVEAVRLLRAISDSAYAMGGEDQKYVIEYGLLREADEFVAVLDAAPAEEPIFPAPKVASVGVGRVVKSSVRPGLVIGDGSDAAPAEDDAAALVAVGAAYVKLRHLDERLSPASIDEDRAAAIALDDAYAAYRARKAPVQG